jgi:hypothetical protein
MRHVAQLGQQVGGLLDLLSPDEAPFH